MRSRQGSPSDGLQTPKLRVSTAEPTLVVYNKADLSMPHLAKCLNAMNVMAYSCEHEMIVINRCGQSLCVTSS